MIKNTRQLDLANFLMLNGFFRIKKELSYKIVRVQSNVVTEVTDFILKDFIRDFFKLHNMSSEYEQFLKKFKLKSLIEDLDYLPFEFIRDTKETSNFFFNNLVSTVNEEGIHTSIYDRLKGVIWNKQIINHHLTILKERSVFESFVENIAGNEDRKKSLETIIGYLLTGFKDPTKTKAIVLTDQSIDHTGQANGGTGKSLLMKGVECLAPTVTEDGKNLKPNFLYSMVTDETQILYFDDVPSKFDFTKFYSIVTGDLIVERKYENKEVIKAEVSPKYVLSTNYVLKSDGGSSDNRRKVEFEFSDYYSIDYTPFDEYGHTFFYDWDIAEWNRFYTYMLSCQQQYLHYGLIEPDQINLSRNKVIGNTSLEFYEFCEENLEQGNFDKKELRQKFSKDLTAKLFSSYINHYCNYKGWGINTRKTNGNYILEIR